ncbi:rRNA maturation RNase YbeY [Roseovarius aestuarii]|nr:rRNA maturation RNase YbeY [Roseovarius aestuarii]
MTVDVMLEDTRWRAIGLEALSERAAQATLLHLGVDADVFEFCVLACNDARIATLNADFRGKPQPTNVLSWPSIDRAAARDGDHPPLPTPSDPPELGDIAIAYDTCAAEASADSKPFDAHVTHLIVHGLLHLLGFDHIRDKDAALMEGIETAILGKLGIADPYDPDDGAVDPVPDIIGKE